ncbi:MAG TPA: hypothetical protein VGI75_12190, partial [Pirellulales bacterium]
MIFRNRLPSIPVGICIAIFGAEFVIGASTHAADYGSGESRSPQFSQLDEAKVRAAGIRKLEIRRLVLYTDLPPAPDVDELPKVFDQAFELWCKYFAIDAAQHADWKMRASLIDDPARFIAAGLIPPDLPKFFNGYTRGHECWLNNQTSSYYRRHLLLHEGVHGIMFTLLGDHAPPWYIEGMAELLGTHHWQDGKLELPYFPKSRDEVPKLGRIDIVQKDFEQHHAKSLTDVMAYDNQAHLKVEPYGWSWAACAFLNGHPRYRDRFQHLLPLLKSTDDFNTKLVEAYGNDFNRLAEEWQVFVADLDYDYDFDRTAIDFASGERLKSSPPLPLGEGRGEGVYKKGAATVTVQADRGWQNSGLQLEAGKACKLTATGRFQVAIDPKDHIGNSPKPWISEPGGVSIRYIHGRPLGQLLAAVRPDHSGNST